MAISDDLALSYSPEELFALASLLGGELLIGFPDPFAGWLMEEITDAVQKAERTLAERGHLSILENGRVVMDVVAAALVGAVANPQAVILLTSASPSQHPLQLGFYIRPPLTVLAESENQGWLLRPVSTPEGVLERIRSVWQIGSQRSVRAPAFALPEDALDLARERIPQGKQAVQECLQQSGVSTSAAAALAQTLTSPWRNGALIAVQRRGASWEVDGLGMLQGENGLWILRTVARQQARWVELSPCSAKRLAEEIEMLVARFVSEK